MQNETRPHIPHPAVTSGNRGGGGRVFGIVLAGGNSSRLHASAPHPVPDKPQLRDAQSSLLEHTVQALIDVGIEPNKTVVVGPPVTGLPSGLHQVQEQPARSGPMVALRAGLAYLTELSQVAGRNIPERTLGSPFTHDDWVAILGADMPHLDRALPTLIGCLSNQNLVDKTTGSIIGVDSGHAQPLVSLVRLKPASTLSLENSTDKSIMAVLKQFNPIYCQLPAGSSADVDTWSDAVREGFTRSGAE